MKLMNRNKTAEALAIERDEEKLHFLEKRDEQTRTKTKPISIEKLQFNKLQISAILFALIVVSQILGLFHSTSIDSDSQLLDQQLQLQSKIQSQTQTQTHSKNVFRVTPLSPECLTHVQAKESEDPKKTFKKNCLFLPPPEEIASKCPSEDLTKHMASFHNDNNNKSETDNLQKYVMFVNTGHSGHSLVGSLLDAHPNMLVSHEGDMFARYTGIDIHYKDSFSTHLENREEIFDEIFSNSLKCALYSRFQNYYNYTVPNGWNGVWIPGELYVIGDKKGGHAFRQLNQLLKTGDRKKMVQTFQEFQKTIDLPIHVINVFWDKKSRVYKKSHDIIEMLRQDMPPHLFSTTDWDNNVYTCGKEAERQSLFLETCNALGVPCDSNILDMWSSMAECKKAKKHLKWWH